jgi:hypothetical protein
LLLGIDICRVLQIESDVKQQQLLSFREIKWHNFK